MKFREQNQNEIRVRLGVRLGARYCVVVCVVFSRGFHPVENCVINYKLGEKNETFNCRINYWFISCPFFRALVGVRHPSGYIPSFAYGNAIHVASDGLCIIP